MANHLFSFFLLAVLVGHVTLRLLKPECDLDPAWGEEDLDTAAHRTVQLLHNHTVAQRESKSAGELIKIVSFRSNDSFVTHKFTT